MRSAKRRPTIWSPTGKPAGVKPTGTVAVGWPVRLNVVCVEAERSLREDRELLLRF